MALGQFPIPALQRSFTAAVARTERFTVALTGAAEITPYVWAPTVNGTFGFRRPSLPLGSTAIRSVGVQLGPNSYLSKLNSAVELTIEADGAHSVAFGDAMYVNASNTGATAFDLRGASGHITFPVNVSTSARLTTTLATVGVGAGPLGLFPRTGTADENETDLSGIVGARGRIGLGSSWFVSALRRYRRQR